MPRWIGAAILHSRPFKRRRGRNLVALKLDEVQASAAREIFAFKRRSFSPPLLAARHARIGEGQHQGCLRAAYENSD